MTITFVSLVYQLWRNTTNWVLITSESDFQFLPSLLLEQ